MMVANENIAAGARSSSPLLWRVALLCGLIQMLDGYDLISIGLAIPSLAKEWSLPSAAFTPAFVSSSIGIMVGAMLAGPAADLFGRKPTLLISVALFGLFSLASAWANSLPMLVALRFVTGIGIGGVMPTTVALTSDYTSDRWRASVVMLMFTGGAIGGFFAGQIAAQVLPHWGWQGIFYVGGVAPLVLLMVLIPALPESPQFQSGVRPPSAKKNPVKSLFVDGLALTTILLWAIFLINLMDTYLINYWLPTVLNLEGFTPSEAAFATSTFPAGAIISALLLGPIIARYGAERTLATSLLIGAISIGIVGLVRLPIVPMMVALAIAGGGFIGSQNGLNGLAAAAYPSETRATGVGWALAISRPGGIVGPIVGGALLSLGLPPIQVMLFVCGPGLVTAALVALLAVRRRRHAEMTLTRATAAMDGVGPAVR
ncbi:aromatic acid/H+ symport family MFS transporter [Bradyrhizobium sp. SSUT18]|uniref:MFS transporter n=1 Tax=Bradyrhizobium sp. SSUT18 TaxID=3040602 RepID=UPI00244814B6|nr:aromatic acid/H+ symport family MFS transporter [Bradyrhizobium sp. SSUT18]MDH2401817.1 aromatic acid/H+ symport family MFS transporter [Bradyrhizobium sp. SSUT18]